MQYHFLSKLEKPAELLLIPISSVALKENLEEISKAFLSGSTDLDSDFQAKEGEILSFYPVAGSMAKRVILLGLGKEARALNFSKLIRTFIFNQRDRLENLTIDLCKWTSLKLEEPKLEEEFAAAFAKGFELGHYRIGLYKTQQEKGSTETGIKHAHLLITEELLAPIEEAVARSSELTDSQVLAMDLVNMPGNKLDADILAQKAVECGKKYGFEVTVLDKKALEEKELNTILAVNQGSTKPPALILMEYKPKDSGSKTLEKIALVGKGVTFDTGGISLKGSTNLMYMKSDMGGAAAVLGTMVACARLQLPVHLIGAIPATDNMPGSNAIVPGDVITSYSGLTIEVEDTDAEGRLILADALAYVNRNYKPEVMIDLATLTGSVVMALGYHAAGMFTADDQLSDELEAAGQASGDRVWRLPLWDDYFKQIDSDIADVKNLGGRPAGSVTAAKFLEKFTEGHPHWAHLDIAGTAFGDSEFSKMKSGTGFGVSLLIKFLEGK